MFFKKDTRSEILTPELAKQVASMPGLLGERDERMTRIRFLMDHIKGHTFAGPTWAIAVNKDTGEQFRINGQHSSKALATVADVSPDNFPQDLKVTIDIYEFDNLDEDASRMFDLFDNPRSARTDTDFMGISKAKFADLSHLDNTYLVKVASGIDTNIRTRAERAAETGTRILETALPHRQHGAHFANAAYRHFAVWLHQWRHAKHFGFISKPGVTSEILEDWKQSSEVATEFWNFVFHDSHPDPEHESRELARELLDLDRRPRRVSTSEYQKKTRKFWHKYYRFRTAELRAAERAVADTEATQPPGEPTFLPSWAEVDTRPPAQL